MPWLNLVGWFFTGLALMVVLLAADEKAGFHRLPVRWMISFYLVMLALPLGMLGAAGAWLGVATTTTVLLLTAAGLHFASGSAQADTPEAPPSMATTS